MAQHRAKAKQDIMFDIDRMKQIHESDRSSLLASLEVRLTSWYCILGPDIVHVTTVTPADCTARRRDEARERGEAAPSASVRTTSIKEGHVSKEVTRCVHLVTALQQSAAILRHITHHTLKCTASSLMCRAREVTVHSAGLTDQLNVFNSDVLGHGFAHVVHSQRSNRSSCERLHLNSGCV